MLRKKTLTLCLVACMSMLAHAHEFWMEPKKFVFSIGEKAAIDFRVGEGFNGEPWDLQRHRIEKLDLHHLQKISDLRSSVKPAEKPTLEVNLTEEGTHLLVVQSNNAFSDLEGDKFNAYLKEDGLDDALTQREETRTLNKNGTEFYSRHSKLLLQVGKKTDDTYKKVVGLPVEIVPDKNPYTVKPGEKMKFKILWQGKPLFGARVKVWSRHDNKTFTQNMYAEKDGTVETPIGGSGVWMISFVKMVPSTTAGADWQSYWGSLVFAISE